MVFLLSLNKVEFLKVKVLGLERLLLSKQLIILKLLYFIGLHDVG